MSFRFKTVLIITLVVLLAVIPLAVYIHLEVKDDLNTAILHYEQDALVARREHLRSAVEIVHSLARNYIERAKSGEFTDTEARARFLSRVESIRYDRDAGYFWVHEFKPAPGDSQARVVMHPTSPRVVGVPISSFVDFEHMKTIRYRGEDWSVQDTALAALGVYPTRFLTAMNKGIDTSGEAFVEYFWMKPMPDSSLTTEGYLKLSYVRLIPEWNWVVGSGVYLDDIERIVAEREGELRIHFRQVFQGGVVMIAGVLTLALLMALGLSHLLTQPLRVLDAHARRITTGEYPDRIEVRGSGEIQELQAAFQVMLDAIRNRETELRRSAEDQGKLNEDLRVLNRAKSMILANVSHELKTPIASIRGYAELLRGGSFGPVTDLQREKLSVCMRNADSLVALINELLSLSEAASRVKGPAMLLDLRDLVRHSVDTIEPKASERQVRITADLPSNAVRVRGERERLERVLLNLLSNAIKFSTQDRRVIVRVERSGNGRDAEVHVSDFGVGIPPEDHERVFQEFYQVDSSPSRRHGGMGLGLAIVKVIVEEAGGSVILSSESGRGTTVTVRFPLADEQSPGV